MASLSLKNVGMKPASLLLDAGGGTCDAVTHIRLLTGTNARGAPVFRVKEACAGDGVCVGSGTIDVAFEAAVRSRFPRNVYDNFAASHPTQRLALLAEWELKKRRFNGAFGCSVRLPFALSSSKSDAMELSAADMRGLFDPMVTQARAQPHFFFGASTC